MFGSSGGGGGFGSVINSVRNTQAPMAGGSLPMASPAMAGGTQPYSGQPGLGPDFSAVPRTKWGNEAPSAGTQLSPEQLSSGFSAVPRTNWGNPQPPMGGMNPSNAGGMGQPSPSFSAVPRTNWGTPAASLSNSGVVGRSMANALRGGALAGQPQQMPGAMPQQSGALSPVLGRLFSGSRSGFGRRSPIQY